MRFKLLILLSITFIHCQGQPAQQSEPDNDLVSFFGSRANKFASATDLDPVINMAADRKLILLGEASHGTHEYYHWRAEISKRLITEKGYNFIAVEGDWASIYRLNKYVKGKSGALNSAREVLLSFNRWPEWMWANTDILILADWLREYNKNLPQSEKVGFYGKDVYGQWEAMDDLLSFTNEFMPDQHNEIERLLNCFASFSEDEWQYARSVASGNRSCETDLQRVVNIINEHSQPTDKIDEIKWFRAKQNALVMQNAESFYRLAVQSNVDSWNSRVNHMWDTVQRLLTKYGDDSRGIVWAHNTHVGDSRATTMGLNNQYNIGNLSRNNLGEENVLIVGFGTRIGKVNAGNQWGSRMQIMDVPDAQSGSLDYYLGQVPMDQFFLVFSEEDRRHPLLADPLGHRAIGVTYNPRSEQGNYVPSLPAYRYDVLIFFQETMELTPVR
ncbi:erythromycin esterase family protein [Alkalitalea saponilacus]|uniref:Erythromycin esterase homolog n=1 Tax=Alkalitalea saponilacus TaxID=889453 RepID=A0A1T5DG57_9BACT|nr:erythromycin esterase family protein [Alkalitalea saponilacus]ASB50689.1 protein-L-isoaspartate O-methyltransferase [Alkalitalea saponilacus]SKB70607.1 Erythromycin esterase homolog [Alkalitalea saponilacus]